jgi:hypothetical protein
VRTAREAGLALAGFARGDGLVLYAGTERFAEATEVAPPQAAHQD